MPQIVRVHAYGEPDVLRLEELDIGEPGPGEARVRVGAIGLNRVESQYRRGHFMPGLLPSKIGFEAAGVVEAVGSGVAGLAPGDRVATLTGVPMAQYGVYGEKILYPADMLVKVPAGQSLVEAAACWMQYVTAYALVSVGAIGADDHVVITAASSSVGLAAIQIANNHGATPIAVTRGRGKAEALLAQGAAHVIVSDEEDVVVRVLEITGGRGARIVFDAVAGPMLSALFAAVAPAGVLILYGVLAGLPAGFPWFDLLGRNLTLRGYAATIQFKDPDSKAAVIDYVQRGLASGALRPVIDRTFDLTEIVDAHRYLESNVQFGKIVVTTAAAGE